jgi:hypothetical protein
MHHALISCAIKLLLSETGGEAALYGVQGERTRRAADVTGTAKEITDALQTRPLGYESWYFTKIMSVEKHLIKRTSICAGWALQVRRRLPSEMAATAKPSEQLRTESCVASGNGRCEA